MKPNNFSFTEIAELAAALKHLQESGKFPLPIASAELQKTFNKNSWVNGADLRDDLQFITENKSLEEAGTKLASWAVEAKTEGQEQTVPETEELQEESKRQKMTRAESKAVAKAKTQKFIKTQEKLYLKLPKDLKTPEITAAEEAKIKNLIEENHVRTNPTRYTNSLAKKIVQQNLKTRMNKEEVSLLRANAKIAAVNYTDKLLGISGGQETIAVAAKIAYVQNPIHIANSLINSDNPVINKDLAKSAQTTALVLENDNALTQNLLRGVAEPKLLQVFYPVGKEVLSFEISGQKDGSAVIEINTDSFTKKGGQLFDFVKSNTPDILKGKIWKAADKIFGNTPWYSKIRGFFGPAVTIAPVEGAAAVQPSLSLLWGSQGIQILATDLPSILSASFGQNILLTPAFNFQLGQFALSRTLFSTAEGLTGQALGLNVGKFGITFITGGERGLQVLINLGVRAAVPAAGASAGVAAGTAGGLSGTLAGVMAALGAWGTPILMAVTAAIGWLVGKILPKIINWFKEHPEAGIALLLGGLLLSSLPLIIIGGSLLLITGLPVLMAGGFMARTALFFGAVGRSLIVTIGTPIIVAIVVFPIVVALILFIINSGAYLVPPKTSLVPFGENPYIDITKTATPSCRNRTGEGCIAGFPDVTYTVTIHAKKGSLINIHFTNSYVVTGNSAPVPNPSVPEINNPPAIISPAKDFTFKYTLPLGAEYNDTVVTDTLSITADVPGKNGFTAATSASVVTGNPPIDCPLLGGYTLWFSYLPGDETSRRHGNNRYWGDASCNSWRLPQSADSCYGPSDPKAAANKCFNNPSGTCSYYGYAIDAFGGTVVLAPRIGKQSVAWSCSYGFSNAGGLTGHTYICTSGQYRLLLTHMKLGAKTGSINSGDKIGELYPQGGNTHLHIEFAINGQYVKPEDYFCSP